MRNQLSSTLAFRSVLHESGLHRVEPAGGDAEKRLEVTVLFTGDQQTLQALQKAGELARGLNALIRLIVPQVVPYPLPLESPPIPLEFSERRCQTLAAAQEMDTRIDIYLCRDLEVLLDDALAAHSTVVIGGRKRWWPTSEECLARRLSRQGHHVIFTSKDRQKEGQYA